MQNNREVATQPKENRLALTRAVIDSAKNAKELLELPAIQNAWVKTYKDITGKNDGDIRFHAEKILFLSAVAASEQLMNADKFSIHKAFTELAISGLTLRDGLTYIVPFKGQANFMVSWKGRLEQMNEIKTIKHVQQPQVVYSTDVFEYELGMKPRIIKHSPKPKTEESEITHVYLVIEFAHGPEVYIMTASEVLAIRDKYSSSYKDYKAKVASGKWQAWMDAPLWVSSPEQAFRKTIVKRVWANLPKLTKLPKHEFLDQQTQELEAAGVEEEDIKINFSTFTTLENDEADINNNQNSPDNSEPGEGFSEFSYENDNPESF